MEVHHHSHTDRKKWTHYFWEFLMLFLAVFCGFLAENQREHLIEHKREKQYLVMLVEDLKTDTAQFNNWSRIIRTKLENLNRSLLLFSMGLSDDSSKSAFFDINLSVLLIPQIIFNERTADQLKNSGAMRMIRNKQVADSLLVYWNEAETIKTIYGGRFEHNRANARELWLKIFDFASTYVAESGMSEKRTASNYLINNNPELLKEYMNYLAILSVAIKNDYIRVVQHQHERAVNLIELIKIKYHLN